MKRANSRFELTEDLNENGEAEAATLYRPEFGEKPTEGKEKIWELMSSYIGGDQRSI